MSSVIRDQWRQRITATLPEERYGTPANVRGHRSNQCQVWYNRDTDTLIFEPAEDQGTYYEPEHLRPEGIPDFYTPPGKTFGPIGLANGAALVIANGEIAPQSGGAAPTSPTMFNPLYIETLERLLDTFPEYGRYRLHEAGFSYFSETWTARQFLTNVNHLRADIAKKAQFRELVLWHGTISYYADRIKREGLTPRNQTGVLNHWSEQWGSREGLVYLSHSSRLTVSRSAMTKARDTLAEEFYGAEKKALDAEGEKLRRKLDSWSGGDPNDPDARAAYDEWTVRSRALYERTRNDPRLQPVLLKVTIPPEGWKNLRPDEDTADYSVEVSKMTGMPEWMGSIGSDAVVAYQGAIPPQWITEHLRGPDALGVGMTNDPGEWWRRRR